MSSPKIDLKMRCKRPRLKYRSTDLPIPFILLPKKLVKQAILRTVAHCQSLLLTDLTAAHKDKKTVLIIDDLN